MARLEIEIGGSDKGGNSELKETIGLLEQLMQMRSSLSIDLVKAETVQQLRSVGEQLTGVNTRIGEYLNLATKATQAWRDDRTEVILDNLASRLAVAAANTEAFGSSVKTQTNELRAYQTAFDQLIGNGLDRTSTEVVALESNISRLTGSIQSQKIALAEQKVFDDLSTKLSQIASDTQNVGNVQKQAEANIRAYQTAINNLIKAGVDPADARIARFKDNIAGLNATIGQSRVDALEKGFEKTGSIILDLNNKITNLQQKLTFATSEASIASLNRELADTQEELKKLGVAGLSADQQLKRFNSSSNAVGTELARIVQDAPYATTALGAIQNNFGAVGNNITRVAELFPQYLAGVRAAAVANGQAATSANVLKAALAGLFQGANAYILVISLIISAVQVWTALSQKRAREAAKEKKAEEELQEVIQKRIKTLEAVTQASLAGQQSAIREVTQINILRKTIEDETVSRENRLRAIRELRKIAPDYFKTISDEQLLTSDLAKEYDKLTDSIMRVAMAKAAEDKLVELSRENLDVEFAILDITKKRGDEAERILEAEKKREALLRSGTNTSATSITPGAGAVRGGQVDNVTYGAIAKTSEQILKSETEITKLADENTKFLGVRRKNLEQIEFLQNFILNGQREGVFSEEKQSKETTKRIAIVKELGEAIRDVYSPDTDSGNLIGLDGLEKANQQVENKYTELFNKLDKTVADHTSYYEDQVRRKVISETEAQSRINEITRQAVDERNEIQEGKQRELDANLIKFNQERANKLAELESRAGLSRIKSRQQELDADRAYWEGVLRNASKYSISLEDITELRKMSEAEINKKWDAKIAEDSFIYQRRTNESLTQLLIRRLNKETELELIAAEGNAEKKLEIQKKYFEQLGAIQARDAEVNFLLNTDFDVFSIQAAELKTQADLIGEAFRNNVIEVDKFTEAMMRLQVQGQQLEVLKSGFDQLTGSVSDSFTGALFGAEDGFKDLGESFKQVAQDIISGLIKIALRQVINQAIGTASMATAAAASAATAATVASSWATAAALVSAATFGANTAPAGIALGSLIASTKAVAGFARGGYTGNMGKSEVAGVVHGQEFVVNANATRDNLPILRAMNSGRDIRSLMASTSRGLDLGSASSGEAPTSVIRIEGSISNNTIKVSNDRATRFDRKFGRG